MGRQFLIATTALGGAVLALTAAGGQRGPVSGPIARYSVDAGTVSGLAASGGGMGFGMSMMFGGGGGGGRIAHELVLRLGSSDAPAKGGPKADHFMPAGARLGKSVPLVTPRETGLTTMQGHEATTSRTTAPVVGQTQTNESPTITTFGQWECPSQFTSIWPNSPMSACNASSIHAS
mgnify:CR=1 FL=1